MARVKRFEGHRFVGTRDDMLVYDCDDPADLAALEKRVTAEDLVLRNRLQAFGPDSLAEARNRGFKAR